MRSDELLALCVLRSSFSLLAGFHLNEVVEASMASVAVVGRLVGSSSDLKQHGGRVWMSLKRPDKMTWATRLNNQK